ncbi:MFS transporter [Streptomyces sp. LBUM 1476]|nr:MFS transporter [Streptomyces sp. LBUM 1476]
MRRRYGLARYLLGAGAARTGDEMSGPALLLAGTATTGSGPLLLAALTASAALGGPVLGALLDRTPHPGRLLGGALATYATTLLLVRWTLGTLPFPAVLSLALTAGLFAPALAAGWTSRLPAITEHLPRAGALDAASYEFAALAGPALAGVVALTAGADAALLTAVALIACALPAAWSLPGEGRGSRRRRGVPGGGLAGPAVRGRARALVGGSGRGKGWRGSRRAVGESHRAGAWLRCRSRAEAWPGCRRRRRGVSGGGARDRGWGRCRAAAAGGRGGEEASGRWGNPAVRGHGWIAGGGAEFRAGGARDRGRGRWRVAAAGEGAEKKSAGGAGVSPCGGMAGVSEVARSLGPGASGIGVRGWSLVGALAGGSSRGKGRRRSRQAVRESRRAGAWLGCRRWRGVSGRARAGLG